MFHAFIIYKCSSFMCKTMMNVCVFAYDHMHECAHVSPCVLNNGRLNSYKLFHIQCMKRQMFSFKTMSVVEKY